MKTKTGIKLLVLQVIFLTACSNVPNDIGIFVANQDIGTCAIEGELKYDVDDDVYVLSGSGENIWFGEDQFHYAWFKSSGDITVRAKIAFEGEGKNAHRKAGWMFRNDLDSSAAHVSATIHGDGLTGIQYRLAKGEEMQEVKSLANDPQYFEVQKSGDEFRLVTWSQEGNIDTVFFNADLLDEAYYVGLFICSHDNSVRESVKFTKVEVWNGGEDIPPYEVIHQ